MNKFLSSATVIAGASIGISTSFVLEVVGATGAIWGASEAVGLRNEDNRDVIRAIALTVGAVALIKHIAGHIERINTYPYSPGFFQSFCRSVNNPYGAIYNQIKQCCQQTNDNVSTQDENGTYFREPIISHLLFPSSQCILN